MHCSPCASAPLLQSLQLFIAKITRSIPEEDIRALLSHYGTVERINMFKPTPDAVYHKARHTMGCLIFFNRGR